MHRNINCEIKWNILPLGEWQKRFNQISQSNILQSYDYAIATCRLNKQSARWGLIKIDGQEAGLVQIIEARALFSLFHAVILDRGPLWFDGFGSAIHVSSFFTEIDKQFPKRWGRKRRIIPELEQSDTTHKILVQIGFEIKNLPKYQTLWWNITGKEDFLYQNLSNSWKKSLKKAENSKISYEFDDDIEYYAEFKLKYLKDKQNRQYEGVSPQLLDNIASLSPNKTPIVILKAMENDTVIASMLFLKHGQCATYQIGWTSEAGRKTCAHHFLLWQARLMYDRDGINRIDLGGINDQEAGITKFKTGTGATAITFVGQYS